jgi:glycosyltransferase involved in cell wall biosynthesis
MRILMLGWEFPPFIAGGLGTACHGLTRALDRLGHEVVFVLPKPVDRSHASHIRLLSPEAIRQISPPLPPTPAGAGAGPGLAPADAATLEMIGGDAYTMPGFERASFLAVPAPFDSPYPSFTGRRGGGAAAGAGVPEGEDVAEPEEGEPARTGVHYPGLGASDAHAVRAAMGAEAGVSARQTSHASPGAAYDGDVVASAERYARLCVAVARQERFDVIHAHDWMTFPAGIALATVSGRPLVVHVHSTEFDRSGEHVNQRVYDIERRGMHAAMRVICVSNLTRSICTRRYGVDARKIDVVYNGIENEAHQPHPGEMIEAADRIVLFLGRITMQKGPEYFIRAAKRVLEKVRDVKFVVAGSGDMAVRMIEEAAALGIGHKVLFTGFLRGRDVDRVFRMADVYVMPSVSEPFGIAPLEAIRNDVPVIISKQSGVSEVLTHALKVDFWDVDEMANKIVAVLRHPPLGDTLREHGSFELRKLTWDGAAQRCVAVYGRALGGLVHA